MSPNNIKKISISLIAVISLMCMVNANEVKLKLLLPEVIEYKDGNDGIQMPIILDLYYDNCDIAHVQIPVILGQDGQLKSTILPIIRIVDDKGNNVKVCHGVFSYWNELVLLIPSRSYVKLPLAGSHIAEIDKAGSYTMGISFLLEDNKGNMLRVEGHAKFIVKDAKSETVQSFVNENCKNTMKQNKL